MNNLIDSTSKTYIECINSALRRYGVNSLVMNVGMNSEGIPVYAVVCPLASEASQARMLLFSDDQFINDIDPEFANKLRGLRADNTLGISFLFSSKLMFLISALAAFALFLGYYFES